MGGGDRHRGRLCAELEVARCEVVQCIGALEEDDLAVGLAAKLEADRHLGHGAVTHIGATGVYPARAVRGAKAERHDVKTS